MLDLSWCRRRWRRVVRSQRGTIAVLAAILFLPMVGLVGLAIDFALWSQSYAAMSLAANGAAMNAVKIAAASEIAGNNDYLTDGATAGRKWFAAQISSRATVATLNSVTPTVSVTQSSDSTILATVAYSGVMQSVFGLIFNVPQYQLDIQTNATINTAPYVEVQILLDNSSSMEIGATQADMSAIELATMCSLSGNADPYNNSRHDYADYTCSYGGYSYTGTCPLQLSKPPYPVSKLVPSGNLSGAGGGPSCKGWPGATTNPDGSWPTAGGPCAFACHSDTTHPAGSGSDSYAVVRATAGTANQITLRFDVVKAAITSLLSSLSVYNIPSLNNISVGISDFGLTLNNDYPSAGEAASDWTAATAAVGAPPTYPNGPDTGIQPATFDANHQNTDFDNAVYNLSQQMTASGDGSSPTSPRKLLFIITDGLQDTKHTGYGPVDPTNCTLFKNLGFTVFVIYMPYYSMPNYFYFTQAAPSVEPVGSSAVTTALQACASSSDDYISASDEATLASNLLTFLRSALISKATLTK